MITPIFNSDYWAAVPFQFWALMMFIFGCMVGSFLNVCIHRLPLGESIVSPPSHCPHCRYAIPWYLNIPLVTWLYLQGKCRNCGAPISIRYFLVELLTGILFLCCWLAYGHQSAAVALICALLMAGLIVATFIDFEHFIIPDEITFGGVAVGILLSCLVPALHGERTVMASLKDSVLGAAVGGGLIYGILRVGKLLFGRHRIALPPECSVVFSETAVHLPDKVIPYEELFYRPSDVVTLSARTVELVDRCYKDVRVRLSASELQIGEEVLDPGPVHYMETRCAEIVLPREAMGLGDVKFMAAIGAFLGWPAVVFSLMGSSLIGSVVGLTLIALRKQAWSSKLPYGPYIAVAAALWVFGGHRLVQWWWFGFR